jgi:hypothetical protein
MVSNRALRLSLPAFAILSFLIAGPSRALPPGTDMDGAPFALGTESCADYLSDIATDQSLQLLYDAWLAGYMKVIQEQLPGAATAPEISGASAWIKNYCLHRSSDTYMTAAVRLLQAKERRQSGALAPPSLRVQVASEP